jgi:hypothetical protein
LIRYQAAVSRRHKGYGCQAVRAAYWKRLTELGDGLMFGDGALSFQEFAMREPHPLATIHDAVLEFLRGRDDAVLYGAQAVNAYVSESRMTQDVDVASTRAKELAEELRVFLNQRFHIAARVREAKEGIGFKVYQVRKPKNRHLIDVRVVEELPPAQRVRKVLVVTPAELIANKVKAFTERRATPKAGTDWRDLAMLLLTFPDLKLEKGPVAERLRIAGVSKEVFAAWKEIVAREIVAEAEDDKFN